MATVFNQYYFDVLKKLRTLARDRKYDDKQARGLLKAIKRHYLSWDKDSAEYRDWFNGAEVAAPWETYVGLENDLAILEQWAADTPAVLYKDMPVGMVRAVFADPTAFHYFSTILCILKRAELPAEEVKRVLGTLKAIPKESDLILAERIAEIQDTSVRHLMERAVALHTAQKAARAASSSAAGPDMSGLEDTSLGKLAKEIMAEVDVDQLQKSVGEDGDILKALANPDSGLLKLVGTVSQKMVSKMATGELNQEKLLTDALQFATKMGGAIPGMGNLAGMGDLLSSVMGGASGSAGPSGSRNKRGGAGAGAGGLDMSMLSSLMNMMGGGAPAAPQRNAGRSAPRPNMAAANQHLRRKTQARSMRDRLERRKENVSASVEGTESPSSPAADA